MKLFNKTGADNNRAPFWGKLFILLGIIVGVSVVVVGIGVYRQIQDEKAVDELARGLEEAYEESQARQRADQYGGETPKETLQLFIDAVERGNYDLASKYFVLEKQEEWEKNLARFEKEDKMGDFLEFVNEATNSTGEYSFSRDSYSIYDPFAIDFILYEGGNWKLSEI